MSAAPRLGINAARFINQLRKASGMSLRRFAAAMQELGQEWDHNTVDRIERGCRFVTLDELNAIAAIGGVQAVDLFRLVTNPGRYTFELNIMDGTTRIVDIGARR